MTAKIRSVAVLGGGTMGSGIAGLCAERDCKVLLLDVSREAAEKALERIVSGRPPALDTPEKSANITLGTLSEDLEKIADCDWICEAVIEDLQTKRDLMARLEPLRRDGSVVSTNTSGIPLRAITEGLPARLRQDIVVTHFFNPVKVMRLLEIVGGEDTRPEVIQRLADFCGNELGKGVVYAKDTVNFIGNRIGCYWMLSGLHHAEKALQEGLHMETIDALMSGPVGLPPTGLFGLIDLIGLDIMDLVGRNLAINLPEGDIGRHFTSLPAAEQTMLEGGQLGRKSGGGFYRMQKLNDGSRNKQTFDLATAEWRDAIAVELTDAHNSLDMMLGDDAQSSFAWRTMGGTLWYAANLVPDISNDIVNIDRAMRWGFAWAKGPFEMLDAIGPLRYMEKLDASGLPRAHMLTVLENAGASHFYRNDGTEYLGADGSYHQTPAEA
ncbi:MAG: 3-hydroxyacyl-CoA dehydrogenase family protein [Rhodospirillales bacterium]|nr:3-hydroxyacyl-CoA dehydrogenase family protein [Rhodospirillales bacterium]